MRVRFPAAVVALIVLSPVWAQQAEPPKAGLQGWGVRVGLADDPDQAVGGFHFNLGDVARRLRFQPSVELGVGDDATILSGTAPVHYRFEVQAEVMPYAGGGIVFALVDTDRRNDDDFEIALKAIGGVEWRLKRARTFSLELNLVFGDIHDMQILAGWTF